MTFTPDELKIAARQQQDAHGMTHPATPQPQTNRYSYMCNCCNCRAVFYDDNKRAVTCWECRVAKLVADHSAALQALREERDAAIAFAAGDGDTAALVERAYLRGLGEQGIADHQLMRDELAKARAEAGRMREALEWCERAMGWATAPNSCIDRYIEVHEMAKQALAGGGGGG